MFRNQNHRFHYFGPSNGVRYFGFVLPCVGITFCSFLGFGFGMMGVIMTSVAYGGTFNDTPLKIIGPFILTLGLLAICTAIGLCIYTAKKRKTEEPQPTQGEPAQYPAANVPFQQYPPPAPTATSPLQPYSPPDPYPVAPQYAAPNVYDPSKRGLVPEFPSSSEPGPQSHGTVEQLSYNPYFAPPAVEKSPY